MDMDDQGGVMKAFYFLDPEAKLSKKTTVKRIYAYFLRISTSFFSLLISVCRQPASLTEYVVYSYIFFWVFPLLPSIKRS